MRRAYTRSSAAIPSRLRGRGETGTAGGARFVAIRGIWRSRPSGDQTMQQGPTSGRMIVPRRGNDWPHSGCRGSMTETMGSEHVDLVRGVVTWVGFPATRRARDEHMVSLADPLTGRQAQQEGFIEATRVTIVDILKAGTQAQLRLSQAGGEPAVTPGGQLAIDEQPQAFFET